MPLLPNNYFFVAVDPIFDTMESTTYQMGGDRTYPIQYRVQVRHDFPFLSPAMVTTAPFIPIGGSLYITPYAYDLLAMCIEKKAVREVKDDWRNWIVTCTFSTKIPRRPQDPSSDDKPDMEKPTVEWGFEVVKLSPMWDLGGQAFLNSANMPFSPPPTFDCGVPVLSITRNELKFDLITAMAYAYSLNDAEFLGFPMGRVQCMPPTAKQKWKGNYMFWQVTYRLRFAPYINNPYYDPDVPEDPITNPQYVFYPFQPKLLDQGYHILNLKPGAATFHKPIPIFDGVAPTHHPKLLDGGGQLAPEDPPVPRFIEFEIYKQQDFTKLIVEGLGRQFNPY